MSAICARLSKGKVEFKEEGKPQVVPSFCPPPWVRRRPARAPQPSADSLLRFSENSPPVRVEPACGSSCAPVSRCSKRSRPIGRTRLRQFVCPAQPMQKRSRPSGSNPPAAVRVPRSASAGKRAARQSNPPAAVRVPWSPCAEKRKAPQNCFHGAQSMHFYSNRSSVSTSLRAGACGSCAG